MDLFLFMLSTELIPVSYLIIIYHMKTLKHLGGFFLSPTFTFLFLPANSMNAMEGGGWSVHIVADCRQSHLFERHVFIYFHLLGMTWPGSANASPSVFLPAPHTVLGVLPGVFRGHGTVQRCRRGKREPQPLGQCQSRESRRESCLQWPTALQATPRGSQRQPSSSANQAEWYTTWRWAISAHRYCSDTEIHLLLYIWTII